MTAPLTRYQPLDIARPEIRIIRLLPSSEPTLVECLTDRVSLDDKPAYVALSYVWGDPSITSPIILDGVQVDVTTNLEAALRQIRSSHHGNSPITLWVDAVCIDQSNFSEQSHQVQLMGKVYGQAQMVYLWLGEEADDSDLAIDMIEAMACKALDPADVNSWSSVPALSQLRPWEAINQLFRRPFWTRLWVLQELVLAPDILLMCGSKHLIWEDLVAAFSVWRGIGEWEAWEYFDQEIVVKIIYNNWTNLEAFLRRRMARLKGEPAPTILEVMIATENFDATDPRDKIYGLLGLARTSTTPDYSKSTADVYLEFAQHQIEKGGNFNILLLAGAGVVESSHRTCVLPSWVCDWKALTQSRFAAYMFNQRDCYQAAGSSAAAFRTSPNSSVLWTPGVICDPVVEFQPEDFDRERDFWNRFLPKNGDQPYLTGIPRLQALFRILLADNLRSKGEAESERLHDSSELFATLLAGFLGLLGGEAKYRNNQSWEKRENFDPVQAFLDWLGEDRNGRSDQAILAPLLGSEDCPSQILWPESREWGGEKALLLGFYERALYNTIRRGFFWTEKGYMGIGPAQMRTGDCVCILLGCNVPFVLREVEHHHILVGPCFVLGLMDGEAMGAAKQGEPTIQDLEIH